MKKHPVESMPILRPRAAGPVKYVTSVTMARENKLVLDYVDMNYVSPSSWDDRYDITEHLEKSIQFGTQSY
ncbi:MAG: hypothetical protein AAF620_14630 [Bacteroidota bacterium]